MSDIEAQVQSSSTAEETPTTAATVSETTTQDGTQTGSDEAITDITDIDSYRNVIGSLSPNNSEQSEEEGSENSSEGETSEENEHPDKEKKDNMSSETEAETEEEDETHAVNTETEEEEDSQVDTGKKRTPQYRWRPKNEVDALAMDIVKRSEKSGKDISMKEALEQAEAILKKDEADDTNANNGQTNSFPNSVDESESLLRDLRNQRKEAFGKQMDFEKAADLDEQVELVKDHIASLKQAEISNQSNLEAQWDNDLKESQAKAIELYPDVTNPESALVKKMIEIDAILKETGDDLFYSPQKPLKLAEIADKLLRGNPKKPGISSGSAPSKQSAKQQAQQVVSSQPVKINRPVQPASGNSRTTQTNKTGQSSVVELEKVQDEESWHEAMSKLKTVAAG